SLGTSQLSRCGGFLELLFTWRKRCDGLQRLAPLPCSIHGPLTSSVNLIAHYLSTWQMRWRSPPGLRSLASAYGSSCALCVEGSQTSELELSVATRIAADSLASEENLRPPTAEQMYTKAASVSVPGGI